MAKKILVTGGAGFVGSHLVDALLERGHSVRVFDSLTSQVHGNGFPEYLSRNIEFIQGDMRDESLVEQALRDVQVIYHLAAAVGVGQSMYEITHYMGANTHGTAVLLQKILDTKSKVEKLIVASSMSIYGEGQYLCRNCGQVAPEPRRNEQLRQKQWEALCPDCGAELIPVPTSESKPLQSTSVYALSKKDQEEICLLFGRTYSLPVVALRYFNIYGPRQALSNPYTGVAAIFASRLLNNNQPLIFEDGLQMRDFVSVHDVVNANVLAMEHSGGDGMALNIGNGTPITIREVASAVTSALGKKINAEVTGKYRAGDIRHCFADISLAKRTLGYEPKVKFETGMAELAGWLRSQQPEDRAVYAVAQLNNYGLTV
jgi:dTDP-L-rhamnose 4-epimerase